MQRPCQRLLVGCAVAILLAGCAPRPSIAWSPAPPTRIDLPVPEAPTPAAPAVQVGPGRVELDEGVLGYLLDVEALYAPARGALALSYRERDAMEAEAREIMAAQELQIREARIGQLRAALAGAGAGAGLVAAVVLAVVLGGR
jgi:hypothetical protein